MAQDDLDRRKHQRLEAVYSIFVEVVSPGSRKEHENTIFRCETIDMSHGGLKIYTEQSIAAGSQLNIAVPMDDWKESLELVGDTVWVKPTETGKGFWVGLELRDSSWKNMKKWFEVVQSVSSAPPGADR